LGKSKTRCQSVSDRPQWRIEPFPVTFSFGWPIELGEGDERQVFAFSLSLR